MVEHAVFGGERLGGGRGGGVQERGDEVAYVGYVRVSIRRAASLED